MRLLFEMDKKDYGKCTHTFTRDSARSIIIRNAKIAMIHSLKYDYYKFPGGGIEQGESAIDSLIRETSEEAGLTVISDSIREYGYVHRIQKSTVKEDECFVQDNYYYLCNVEEGIRPQKLDDYESDEHFTLEYVMPENAILSNRTKDHGPKDPIMIEREARVLEMLLSERLI
ncbi:MAG: NUDIX domain-containing protein [Clostridia bacterium]|nr:NUDIX domain-containing protein [Clostridia bacterium]